jgi:hypothetical protein
MTRLSTEQNITKRRIEGGALNKTKHVFYR